VIFNSNRKSRQHFQALEVIIQSVFMRYLEWDVRSGLGEGMSQQEHVINSNNVKQIESACVYSTCANLQVGLKMLLSIALCYVITQ